MWPDDPWDLNSRLRRPSAPLSNDLLYGNARRGLARPTQERNPYDYAPVELPDIRVEEAQNQASTMGSFGRGLTDATYGTLGGTARLFGADGAADWVDTQRKQAQDYYGEPTGKLGTAAYFGGQLVGQGAQFLAPGAIAGKLAALPRVARAAPGLARFLNPAGYAAEAAQGARFAPMSSRVAVGAREFARDMALSAPINTALAQDTENSTTAALEAAGMPHPTSKMGRAALEVGVDALGGAVLGPVLRTAGKGAVKGVDMLDRGLTKLDDIAGVDLWNSTRGGAVKLGGEKPTPLGNRGAVGRTAPQQGPTPRLMALHNVKPNSLAHLLSDEGGELPMPSIAVAREDTPFTDFGPISLLGRDYMGTPSPQARVFDADAYTGVAPRDLLRTTTAHDAASDLFDPLPEMESLERMLAPLTSQDRKGIHSALRDYLRLDKGLRPAQEIAADIIADVEAGGFSPAALRMVRDPSFVEAVAQAATPVRYDQAAGHIPSESPGQYHHDVGLANMEDEARDLSAQMYGAVGMRGDDPRGTQQLHGYGWLRGVGAREFDDVPTMRSEARRRLRAPASAMQGETEGATALRAAIVEAIDSPDRIVGPHEAEEFLLDKDVQVALGRYMSEVDHATPDPAHLGQVFRDLRVERPGGREWDARSLSTLADGVHTWYDAPTNYFESKFTGRPLRVEEFAGASVPEGTDQSLIDGLKAKGLDIDTYDPLTRPMGAGDTQPPVSQRRLDSLRRLAERAMQRGDKSVLWSMALAEGFHSIAQFLHGIGASGVGGNTGWNMMAGMAGGGAVGGAAGGMIGDTPEERQRNMMIGAGLGMGAGFAGGARMSRGARDVAGALEMGLERGALGADGKPVRVKPGTETMPPVQAAAIARERGYRPDNMMDYDRSGQPIPPGSTDAKIEKPYFSRLVQTLVGRQFADDGQRLNAATWRQLLSGSKKSGHFHPTEWDELVEPVLRSMEAGNEGRGEKLTQNEFTQRVVEAVRNPEHPMSPPHVERRVGWDEDASHGFDEDQAQDIARDWAGERVDEEKAEWQERVENGDVETEESVRWSVENDDNLTDLQLRIDEAIPDKLYEKVWRKLIASAGDDEYRVRQLKNMYEMMNRHRGGFDSGWMENYSEATQYRDALNEFAVALGEADKRGRYTDALDDLATLRDEADGYRIRYRDVEEEPNWNARHDKLTEEQVEYIRDHPEEFDMGSDDGDYPTEYGDLQRLDDYGDDEAYTELLIGKPIGQQPGPQSRFVPMSNWDYGHYENEPDWNGGVLADARIDYGDLDELSADTPEVRAEMARRKETHEALHDAFGGSVDWRKVIDKSDPLYAAWDAAQSEFADAVSRLQDEVLPDGGRVARDVFKSRRWRFMDSLAKALDTNPGDPDYVLDARSRSIATSHGLDPDGADRDVMEWIDKHRAAIAEMAERGRAAKEAIDVRLPESRTATAFEFQSDVARNNRHNPRLRERNPSPASPEQIERAREINRGISGRHEENRWALTDNRNLRDYGPARASSVSADERVQAWLAPSPVMEELTLLPYLARIVSGIDTYGAGGYLTSDVADAVKSVADGSSLTDAAKTLRAKKRDIGTASAVDYEWGVLAGTAQGQNEMALHELEQRGELESLPTLRGLRASLDRAALGDILPGYIESRIGSTPIADRRLTQNFRDTERLLDESIKALKKMEPVLNADARYARTPWSELEDWTNLSVGAAILDASQQGVDHFMVPTSENRASAASLRMGDKDAAGAAVVTYDVAVPKAVKRIFKALGIDAPKMERVIGGGDSEESWLRFALTPEARKAFKKAGVPFLAAALMLNDEDFPDDEPDDDDDD